METLCLVCHFHFWWTEEQNIYDNFSEYYWQVVKDKNRATILDSKEHGNVDLFKKSELEMSKKAFSHSQDLKKNKNKKYRLQVLHHWITIVFQKIKLQKKKKPRHGNTINDVMI